MKSVRIVPLGGLGEIGKNMTAIEYEDEIILIDAGAAFPEEDLLGIDVVIPDFEYLKDNKEKFTKVFITHGHEDHIGALPYLLKDFPDVCVYTTKLTSELIKKKLRNQKLKTKNIKVINKNSEIKSKRCKISFFSTNHSIPDSVGIAIETPVGIIVHTGDFKVDFTPVDKSYTDFQKLGEIGRKGVLALLSDSTNAEKPGISPSESEIAKNLEKEMRNVEGRIIVATFASSLYRVQSLINIAEKTGRKVAIFGRSMENNVKIATKFGYLKVADDLIVSPKELSEINKDRVMVITTGAQGEPLAGLSRMANGDHKYIEAGEGDTVIFSSSPIPGNEKSVSGLIDLFMKKNVNVVYGKDKGIHTSGHGNQEEQKLMLSILRPKFFIPTHGEYRMLKKHGELAESIGVKKQNIFICENGDVVELSSQRGVKKKKVKAGAVLVDNSGLGDIDQSIIRDRKRLAEHGVAVIQATHQPNKSKKVKIEFILRGMVAKYNKGKLNEELTEVIGKKMEEHQHIGQMKRDLYSEIGSIVYHHVKRNPTIILLINNFRKKEGFQGKNNK